MIGRHLRDVFITAPRLARLLAKDPAFVSEVGLDGFPYRQIVRGLKVLLRFILAMHSTARWGFATCSDLTLDEKLIRLIYSRFVLFPKFSKVPVHLSQSLNPEALNAADKCYEDIRRNADQSECKWDSMPLYDKFFEICVRVSIEEDLADAVAFRTPTLASRAIGTRAVMAAAFKAVFSHVKWELDAVSQTTANISSLSGNQPQGARNAVKTMIAQGAAALFRSMHKTYADLYLRQGFSPEEVFWMHYAQISSSVVWDRNAEYEINLTDVLLTYLTIYREKVRPEMSSQEDASFLEVLRERFGRAEQIINDCSLDMGQRMRLLGQLVLAGNPNVERRMEAAGIVVRTINACRGDIPFKLVRDA